MGRSALDASCFLRHHEGHVGNGVAAFEHAHHVRDEDLVTAAF